MAGKGKKKPVTLTQALAQFLGKTLLPDLKERAKQPAVAEALTRQWQAEKAGNRTADGFLAWEQRALEQVGAAWVLSCVFVRTLEDRDLLELGRLAGAGAADSEQLFFELGPSLTARDYLLTVFKEVGSLPGAEALLGPGHNPVWRLAPSAEAARALLDFFRQQDAQGALVWRFAGTDTRFLGDLYQDLSEDVRKRYALLQTPDFVERFILDQTLEPAIAEFGLQTVRVIDPTCGSGHFLLGAFDRLLSHRRQAAPAVDVRDHASAALGQVYGVDVNPYAVAIARFRLTLAYLQHTGITKLAQAPRMPLNLVVADSLLHGGGKGAELLLVEQNAPDIDRVAWHESMFALDDETTGRRILRERYHVVVGNPPYITCKDSALREVYRARYRSAAGKYALAAPFTENFFHLATDGGFVGLINANSFMKREFGKTLIEDVLPELEMTSVIDTSGTYIPGHGTPTVLLFGRNRKPTAANVHAVLGKRGEPSTPEDAEKGLVWRSIVDHQKEVGFENEYISVAEMPRATLNKHPWSLGGGGAADLKALLEERAELTLGKVVDSIGFMAIMGEDEVFVLPGDCARRRRLPSRLFGIGEVVRDWSVSSINVTLFPYDENWQPSADDSLRRWLWPFRTNLIKRLMFGKTQVEAGLEWFEYRHVGREKIKTPLSIAFAFVATHNHFVLDRGGKVFNRSAPIIKLPESATEDDHLALLAYLNSSTACFWMKQAMMSKGGSGVGRGIQDEDWESRFEFDGTKLKMLPVPDLTGFAALGLAADQAAHQMSGAIPSVAVVSWLESKEEIDLASCLRGARAKWLAGRVRLVGVQEAIDWAVYERSGMTASTSATGHDAVEPMEENQRPFEFLLGKKVREGAPTSWFNRHDRSPATSEPLQVDFDHRAREIEANPDIAFIENQDFKRRFYPFDWQWETENACREVFLNSCEKICATRPVLPASVRSIVTATTTADERIQEVVALSSSGEAPPDHIVAQSVPFVAAEIFTELGLTRRGFWRKTWDLQRREDLGESVGEIPVPPKYDQKDYRDPAYWRLRGKLDVPKERFISYPGCEKDGDPSPLIGWAGWNHLQRAQALVALYNERKDSDGWPRERLMPMLVGLHELMFWLELWHSKPEAGSQNPAREFKQFLDAELNTHQLTVDDLEAWRPPARKASAKRTAAKAIATAEPTDDAAEPARAKRTRGRKADATSAEQDKP